MEYKKENIINEFIANAIIQGECTYNGDYKRGNKSSKILFGILDLINQDRELATEIIDELMKSEEANVLIWICGFSLDISYRIDDAKNILIKLSKDENLGILGLNAETTLKEWENNKLNNN